MAKVAKKRKRKLGGRSMGGGTSGKKVTPLRPYINPRTAPCQPGCPIGNDARGALAYVGSGERCKREDDESLEQAFHIFAKTNPFPAITGRLCTRCCEGECNRQHKDGPVNINKFERFVGDYAIEKKLAHVGVSEEKRDGKIAVVGSGPAGLTCAYHLARQGWGVTVFEAMSRPGGFLRYVAPFRLPRPVLDAEIQRILDLGIELRTDTLVGKDISMEQLQKEYEAVYVAVGAHKERRELDAPWDAENILTGVDFMARLNPGEALDIGSDVVIVGGGNAAVDAARTCKRLGATATLLYRRTKDDMPAIPHDVDQAEAEGITFDFLAEPIEVIKDGNRAVKLACQRLKLGEPDGRGRRRPVPIPGEVFERPLTTLIMGQIQEPDYADPLSRVAVDGSCDVDPGSFVMPGMPGLFVGGDANKLGHVTVAIANGRLAAEEIDTKLLADKAAKAEGSEEEEEGPATPPLIFKENLKLEFYEAAERRVQSVIPIEDRLGDNAMTLEVNLGLSREDAVAEAKRCFSCGMCMDCDNCWMYCQDQAVDKLAKTLPVGQHYQYKHDLCTGCEKCAEECPCGYLKMV